MDITYNHCLPVPPRSGPHCLSSSRETFTASSRTSVHSQLSWTPWCATLLLLVDNCSCRQCQNSQGRDIWVFRVKSMEVYEKCLLSPSNYNIYIHITYICIYTYNIYKLSNFLSWRLTIKVLIHPLELGNHDYKIVWSNLEKLSEINRGASAPSVTRRLLNPPFAT